ncbi:hypothetical protein ABBQ38_004963 [Trebouxia sp. C0009 RCD-2024]
MLKLMQQRRSLQAASSQKWEIDVISQGLKDESEKANKAAAAYQGELELLQTQLADSKKQEVKSNNAVLAAEAALKAAEEAKSTSESRLAATDRMCSQLLALCHTTLQAPGGIILPAASAGIPVAPPTPAAPAAPAAVNGLSSHLAKAHKPVCEGRAKLPQHKKATKFEGVPGCPGYFWPSDPNRRDVHSCGFATFTIVEEWSLQNKDKLQRRARTLKSMPLTQGMLPYLQRDVASLKMLSGCCGLPVMHASDVTRTDSGCLESRLCLSGMEGLTLAEHMPLVLRTNKGGKAWQEVIHMLRSLLQMLARMHREGRVICGNLTPDSVVVVGARQEAVLVDYCSSRAVGPGDQAQLPYTLGFAAPEMLAEDQRRQVASEKADVYAVGVMGLMWMGADHELPFGPSRQHAQEVQAAWGTNQLQARVEAARQSVVQRQHQWAELYAATGAVAQASLKKFLGLPPASAKKEAADLLSSLLHPDPAARATAAEALQHTLLRA